MNEHRLFSNKANRDAAYRELKAKGITAYRGSIRNQLIHPQYVEDVGAAQEDCGFGNTIYKTSFSVLYTLDTRHLMSGRY